MFGGPSLAEPRPWLKNPDSSLRLGGLEFRVLGFRVRGSGCRRGSPKPSAPMVMPITFPIENPNIVPKIVRSPLRIV